MAASVQSEQPRWSAEFRDLLTAYVQSPSDAGLQRAVALGQRLGRMRVALADVWAAQMALLATLAKENRRPTKDWVAAAAPFFTELLRGYDAGGGKGAGSSETVVALRESEERFRAFLEDLDDAAYRTDALGNVTYVNKVSHRLTGRPPGELIGRPFLPLFTAESQTIAREVFERTLRGESPEYELTLTTGRTCQFKNKPLRDPRGRVIGVFGIARDVTERKRAESELHRHQQDLEDCVAARTEDLAAANRRLEAELAERRRVEAALRESEEKLAGILGAATDHMSMIDETYTIVWANNVAKRVFGADLVGRKCYAAYHDRAEACDPCLVRESFADGKVHEGEIETTDPEGKRCVYWSTASVAACAADGRPRRVVEVSRNITDRKRTEEAVREHQQQLAHAGRLGVVGEMASGLAHELAQPLSAILYFARGCATRLEAGQWGAAEIAPALQQIADQAERAGEFIRRIKAFVRRTPPQRNQADINEIVRESLSFASTECARGRAHVQTDLATELPPVVVDRIQIEQVVLNLLRNGIEAVAALPAAERALRVSTGVSAKGVVCVRVWDAGYAITPSDTERIFDPFYTTKPAGTGLGLSISRTIIEAHRGRLWAEPDAAGGKSLAFTLPIQGQGDDDAE